MHPSKVEALQELEKVSSELESEIVALKGVAGSPDRAGWSGSLKAAATLFVLGAGTAFVDAVGFAIRKIDDRHWN